jgi:hypothetical protein
VSSHPPNACTISGVASVSHASRSVCFCSWLVCDDTACGYRTQNQSIVGSNCLARGCHGRLQPEFGEKLLYTQLKYFDVMFDEAEQKQKYEGKAAPVLKESHSQVFGLLKTQMTSELSHNAYNFCRLPFNI